MGHSVNGRPYSRRHMLMAGGAAIASPAMMMPRAVRAQERQIRFRVTRNGSEIGRHLLNIVRDGDRTFVDIDIKLEVSFAFITLFSYEHRNREEWDAAGLVRFDSATDDDGEKFVVSAERNSSGVRVAGKDGVIQAPTDVPPTTYWQRAFLDGDRWIDTQRGRIVQSAVSLLGTEQITAGGQLIEADRFRLEGDLDLDLWYLGEEWVKLQFTASDDSLIDYELVTPIV